jgi:hypothetical protein
MERIMSFMSEAIDNWPEDEAQATYRAYLGDVEDYGEYVARQALQRRVDHMAGVFDDPQHLLRYRAELQRLLLG